MELYAVSKFSFISLDLSAKMNCNGLHLNNSIDRDLQCCRSFTSMMIERSKENGKTTWK